MVNKGYIDKLHRDIDSLLRSYKREYNIQISNLKKTHIDRELILMLLEEIILFGEDYKEGLKDKVSDALLITNYARHRAVSDYLYGIEPRLIYDAIEHFKRDSCSPPFMIDVNMLRQTAYRLKFEVD